MLINIKNILNKHLRYIFIFCLFLIPIFVIAQSVNSISTQTTNISSTSTLDTSINYTYITLEKRFIYPKDTQIGLLERELYKKTPISTIQGITHWYGAKFHGRKMANAEKFDMNDPTIVAHRTLKFGTKLKITNIKNNNVIYGIVKDRGPYSYKWIKHKNGKWLKQYKAEIDVSYAAAKLLGIDKPGLGSVKIEVY